MTDEESNKYLQELRLLHLRKEPRPESLEHMRAYRSHPVPGCRCRNIGGCLIHPVWQRALMWMVWAVVGTVERVSRRVWRTGRIAYGVASWL